MRKRITRNRSLALLIFVASALAFVAACPNPDYRPDALGTCSNDQHCSEPTPVCDPRTNTCVQCTPESPSACSGATPVCSQAGTCRPCRGDSECTSQVCQLSGSCLPEDQALYVSPAGMGGDCTAAQPCMFQMALTQFTPQRFVIKLAPGTYRGPVSIGDNQRLEIHGDGADLTRATQGPIVEVRGLAELTVLDLRIHDAFGAYDGHGISCAEDAGNQPVVTLHRARIDTNRTLGVTASGCKLHIARSRFISNQGGGISTFFGEFVIVGNVFFANGSSTTVAGGIAAQYLTSTYRLEFNTFKGNFALDGRGGAINCALGTFTARNNIIGFNGGPSNMGQGQVQGCTHEYSLAYPGPVLEGIGNSSADPMFVDYVKGDLHLMAGSPARGAADPGADLTGPAAFDIDGDERTSPADIGADEVP